MTTTETTIEKPDMLGKLKRPSSLLTLTLVLLILGSLMQRVFGHYTNRDVDFYVYYFAAQTVHDHPKSDLIYFGDLDGNPETKNAPVGSELRNKAEANGVGEVMLYLYPPLLADSLVPISGIPPHTAATLWRFFNVGLIFLSLLALARMLKIPVLSGQFVLLVVAAYSFFPTYEALAVGQITIVMLALWAIAVVAYSEDAIALSAFVIAFATLLKITPLLVVPIFIILKDRRWVAWYAASIAFLLVVLGAINGWHTLETSARVLAAVGGSVPAAQNKCISALLAWIYYGKFLSMQAALALHPPRLLGIAEKVASFGFYLVCLFLVWRQRLDRDPTAETRTSPVPADRNRMAKVTAFAIFAMVTPTISPVSWRHAYCIAIVPLVILWMQALRTSVSTLHVALLSLSTLAMGSLFFDLVAGQSHVPQFLQIISASVLTVSTVALCIETLSHRPPPTRLAPSPA